MGSTAGCRIAKKRSRKQPPAAYRSAQAWSVSVQPGEFLNALREVGHCHSQPIDNFGHLRTR